MLNILASSHVRFLYIIIAFDSNIIMMTKGPARGATFLATFHATVAEVESSFYNCDVARNTLHRVTPPKNLVARNVTRKVASSVCALSIRHPNVRSRRLRLRPLVWLNRSIK